MVVASSEKIPFDQDYRCGRVQVKNVFNRIVNGEDVTPPHAHPWMVTISKNKYWESQGRLLHIQTVKYRIVFNSSCQHNIS